MKLRDDFQVQKNTGKAFVLERGQRVRVFGESNVDFVAFNHDNLRERFDQARTKSNQGKIFLSVGDKLYSKLNSVMFSIVEDTFKEGTHDLQFGMCSAMAYRLIRQHGWSNQIPPGTPDERLPGHGCWENLSEALRSWNIAPEDIPSPFNIFQYMEIDGRSGRMRHSEKRPRPGTYMDLRAEMKCLVGVSACPEGGRGKPVRVQVYDE